MYKGLPNIQASASIPPTPHPRTLSAFIMVVCESVPTRVSGKAIVSPSCLREDTTLASFSRFTWCTIPVPGGTTLKLSNAFCAHLKNAYLSPFRSYSRSTFIVNAFSVLK